MNQNYSALGLDEDLLFELAEFFKVFGDSTRIRLLYALLSGEKNVSELASDIEASQSAVSHQLRVLKSARLVRFRRDGKEIRYALNDGHIESILATGMEHITEGGSDE